MKKLVCSALVLFMALSQFSLSAAAEGVQETYTREELLAMDQDLDSDGDGIADVVELAFDMDHLNADTDGDGINDYVEFYMTHTDVLTPDSFLDSDNDGLTNAEEIRIGTNPADFDTDIDGYTDGQEVNEMGSDPLVPAENISARVNNALYSTTASTTYAGTLYTNYDSTYNSINVGFNYSNSWFSDSPSEYKPDLAVISSLLSAIAYDKNFLNVTSGMTVTVPSQYPGMAVNSLLSALGFSYCNSYSLTDSEYDDIHLSRMYVAHKTVSIDGTPKNLICVIIRGTDGSLEEWRSNFDIGKTTLAHSEWTTTADHKGFSITANRLNSLLDEYISDYCNSAYENIFWMTGHSRGAAIANIMASKRIIQQSTVFAYTFASPNTTQSSIAHNAMFNGIHNIVNSDDLVTCLPLESPWGFTRYGKTYESSINSNHRSEWNTLTGETYQGNQTGINSILSPLQTISTSRNGCYNMPTSTFGYQIVAEEAYLTRELATAEMSSLVAQYPDNTSGTYECAVSGSGMAYMYSVSFKPVFMMELLAYTMANPDIINKANFAAMDLPLYLQGSRNALAAGSVFVGFSKPHYNESYYLLATHITEEDVV